MDTFAQTIAQFANLRALARMTRHAPVRELFPKATGGLGECSQLFEIAWSFLSKPKITPVATSWKINGKFHRIGGLPAAIQHMKTHHVSIVLWFEHGKRCNARRPTFVPD